MKHKILIDTIALLSPLTGIGRYTYEIASRVDKSRFDPYFFYGYHSQKLLNRTDRSELKTLKAIVTKIPLLKRVARKTSTLWGALFSPKYALYWQPNFIPNQGIEAEKTVTSVHDFSFILYRDFHPKERIDYFEKHFFQNIGRSDMIITGSEFSKKEIIERLRFDPDKVKVIYHGLDHQLFRVYPQPQTTSPLPPQFIFSVGSIEPRKNLIGLLKAYDRLDPALRRQYKLVLAGFKGWENEEIMALVNKNRNDIHYLGYVSDTELANIYNLASLFVYPSFYEGFGLPPLEAMACGTPVVTSSVSSLPEVGGDAVVYCDPNNIGRRCGCLLRPQQYRRYRKTDSAGTQR